MAHNTYVWVGFNLDAATQRLAVGVVAGITGQSDDLASSATYCPVTKLHFYDHFTLKDIRGLPSVATKSMATNGMATNGDSITDSEIASFSQAEGPAKVELINVIQYSPQGAASILPDSSSHWIQIGLQSTGKTTDPNCAVLQVASLTGQVQVFRP